jgi:hypothetical protein
MKNNKKTTNARMTLREAILFMKNPGLEKLYNAAIHEFWEQTGYSIPEDTAFVIGQEVWVELAFANAFATVTAVKQDRDTEYYDLELQGDKKGLRYLYNVPLDFVRE